MGWVAVAGQNPKVFSIDQIKSDSVGYHIYCPSLHNFRTQISGLHVMFQIMFHNVFKMFHSQPEYVFPRRKNTRLEYLHNQFHK